MEWPAHLPLVRGGGVSVLIYDMKKKKKIKSYFFLNTLKYELKINFFY